VENNSKVKEERKFLTRTTITFTRRSLQTKSLLVSKNISSGIT
jgi:hypothetical protein